MQEKLHTCEAELAEQHRIYHIIRDERDRLHSDLMKIQHDHSRLSHDHSVLATERGPLIEDNRRMQEQLHKGHEDRKHLQDTINHLTVRGF